MNLAKEGDGLANLKKQNEQVEECNGDCSGCRVYESKCVAGGLMVPVKRKVVTKYYPPELSAIKLLAGEKAEAGEDLFNLTEAELLAKKKALIKQLSNLEKGEK